MKLKKFFIWIVKSLIVIVFATFIFSAIVLDVPILIEGLFGDIFTYASPDAQNRVIGKLAEACSSDGQESNVVTISQLCSNVSLLDSMKQNCDYYHQLKAKGIDVIDEAKVRASCDQIESGNIENQCRQMRAENIPPQESNNIGDICRDYKEGKIDNKEFFFNVISTALPSSAQTPQMGMLEKYNKAIGYLNRNKALYLIILLSLLIILYLLIMNIGLFLFTLSEIAFSIGVFITLPYFSMVAYDRLIGIDTTTILGAMLGTAGSFDTKSILSVIILMFLRTYNSFIVTVGILFLSAGIGGKVYNFVSKRRQILKGKEDKKSGELEDLLAHLEKEAKKDGLEDAGSSKLKKK